MTRIGIPAYVWEDNQEEWGKLDEFANGRNGKSAAAFIVTNPNNGPDAFGHPSIQRRIDRATSQGTRCVGYVATEWGTRPVEQLLGDARRTRNLYYPQMLGLMFDQVTLRDTVENVAYTDALCDLARPYRGTAIFNPGVQMIRPERMLPGSIWCTFEETAANFINQYPIPPAGMGARTWFIVHSCPDVPTAQVIAGLMQRNGVGYGYITRDTLPNPFDTIDFECNAFFD